MTTQRNIARAAVLIVIVSLSSKVLGFVREMIIAAVFGTTYRTDAYFIGIMGPEFIRDLIAGGVLAAVFIPVYTSCLSGDCGDKPKNYLNDVTTLNGIILAAFSMLGIPLAPYLVKAIAPEIDAATFALTVSITRLIFPAILFGGMAALYGNLLNIKKHFFTPSIGQVVLNLAIIAGVLLLGHRYGIQSLALGYIVGMVLQFLVLVPALRSNKISYRPSFNWKSDEMKAMYRLWMPLFVALFIAAANDVVSRSIAAGLAPGNIAALSFANRVRETIWILGGVPLGTVIFPYVSAHAAKGETKDLENLTRFAIRLTTFITVPLCLIMLFYSKPIVQLLFQRGLFDNNSTALTSRALAFYSIGALFYALHYVILRIYFSIKETIRPLKAFAIALIINVAAGLVLRKYMSIGGVTLARSLSDIAIFIILMAGLSRVFAEFNSWKLYKEMLKMGVIALSSVAFSYFIYIHLPHATTFVFHLAGLSLACSIAFSGYLILSLLFKVREVISVWNIIKQKFAFE